MAASKAEETPLPSEKLLNTSIVTTPEAEDDRVKMKKQLGLLEGVAIILGIICGSGIMLFVTKKISF